MKAKRAGTACLDQTAHWLTGAQLRGGNAALSTLAEKASVVTGVEKQHVNTGISKHMPGRERQKGKGCR